MQYSVRPALRYQQHMDHNDHDKNMSSAEVIYQRAGVSTPWMRARGDWYSPPHWLRHVTQQWCRQVAAAMETPPRSSSSSSSLPNRAGRLIWLATTPTNDDDECWWSTVVPRQCPTIQLVESRLWEDNPWDWDQDDDDNNNRKDDEGRGGLLNSLPALKAHILELMKRDNTTGDEEKHTNRNHHSGHVALIVSSCTPLLLRHGWHRMNQFWQDLIQNVSVGSSTPTSVVLVLPVATEVGAALESGRRRHPHRHQSHQRHVQALQDMAQGLLHVDQGQATWWCRGIRERHALRRMTLGYRFVVPSTTTATTTTAGGGNKNPVEMVVVVPDTTSPNHNNSTSSTPADPDPNEKDNSHQSSSSSSSYQAQSSSSGHSVTPKNPSITTKKKTALTWSEEGRQGVAQDGTTPTEPDTSATTTTTTRPTIFMQDNDPEFDDYDEEDPDDDLDI